MIDSAGVYRRDGLAVLSNTTAPAVLVETAVIVNAAEERWRANPDVANALAAHIAAGIKHCTQNQR